MAASSGKKIIIGGVGRLLEFLKRHSSESHQRDIENDNQGKVRNMGSS